MTGWSSHSVETNGIHLHYHRTGADRPSMVLAHGFTDMGLCWTLMARKLEGHFDVIMVDARGHGHSDKPESGYGPSDHAADLAGLVTALALEKPVLLGHSMGARTIATMAASYPDLPGRIVLEDPPWRSAEAQDPRAGPDSRRQQIVDNNSKSHRELVDLGRTLRPSWDDAEFEPWAESKRLVSPSVVESNPQAWQEIIPGITCPALLVTADVDAGAIVTAQIAREAVGLNPNLQVSHIPGAGHNIHREQFALFMESVTAFLQVENVAAVAGDTE